MSIINFTTFGSYSVAQGNCVKVQVITSTNSWSVISNLTLALATDIDVAVQDRLQNYYVGQNSCIYKYTAAFISDTSWGTDAKVLITSVFGAGKSQRMLAVNNSFNLFVIEDSDTAENKNCWAFDSAGTLAWVTCVNTVINAPVSIAPLSNENVIVGGATVSTLGIREISKIDGSIVRNYPAISMTYHYGLCANSAGDIFTGGQDGSAGPKGIGYKFTVGNPVATWSIITQKYFIYQAAFNSSYIIAAMQEGGTTKSLVVWINNAGAITAAITINLSDINCLTLTTVPNEVVIADYEAWAYYVVSQSAITAQSTALACITIRPNCLVGRANVGIDILSPAEKFFNRHLIAMANDQVWYESVSSTMSEITAARNVFSMNNAICASEAFQKLFVVNGTVLKTIDFLNTKCLITAGYGTNRPLRGDILTGQSSGVQIITDFLSDALTTSQFYATKITTGSLISGETLANATLSISFVVSSAVNTGPFIYTWTPYENNTTAYGDMPSQATLVCRYRGRLVLAGHPNYPHQWYMSKVADSWNWLFNANDPLTAVAGNNADAGEVGDIIRALIPYGDDYLVFGCANSMWLLSGDPASGGSLDEIDNTTGIQSQTAWCKDSRGNLYFFGDNGIYKMAGGRERPVNISKGTLPNLIKDWALDADLHRVVFAYDPEREGILITKTTIATGACIGYFYDLMLEAFFPETHPDSCGIYCAYNYNADDPLHRKLLLGGADAYLRTFDDSTLDDEITSGITTIDSYVALPIEQLSQDPDKEGKLTELTIEMAGGVISGAYSDSGPIVVSFYSEDDAEAVLEDIIDGTALLTIATISAGRQTHIRTKIRGQSLGIKLAQNASGVSWAVNRIFGTVKDAGKLNG